MENFKMHTFNFNTLPINQIETNRSSEIIPNGPKAINQIKVSHHLEKTKSDFKFSKITKEKSKTYRKLFN